MLAAPMESLRDRGQHVLAYTMILETRVGLSRHFALLKRPFDAKHIPATCSIFTAFA
jgi:hypothetical protein